MITVVPDLGTPSVTIGMRAPTEAALLAASGAARPSIVSFPKRSSSLENCFSLLYAIIAAMVPPTPVIPLSAIAS